ncbi:MAG: PEP-CTERM sorting domain-containing protein [Acidobacteria bacterium]|nr:PEP-CTERM sorting domain-containing protein [Acidobacteriota bacterium]
MNRIVFAAVVLGATLLGLAPGINSSLAAVVPLLVADGSGTVRTDGGFTVGYQFKVGSNSLAVSSLGIWDGKNDGTGDGADGLKVAHGVGLWTEGGTLLGSVTVPAGTAGALVDEFRYASLTTAIALTSGLTYRIGAFYGSTDGEPFRNDNNPTPPVSTVANTFRSAFAVGGSLAFPATTSTADKAFIGPNLLAQVLVPEPTTLSLLVVAGIGMWWRNRLRISGFNG